MNFSLRNPAPPTAELPPAVRDLPPLHSPPARRKLARRKPRGWMIALAGLGGVGLALGAFPRLREPLTGFFKPDTSKVLTYTARRVNLVVTVKERGNLESSNNQDVVNEVEGQTTIISIRPEGTHVEKGELVCELDSAALRDQLVNQEITTKGAKAQYDNAAKTYEVAEIAVKEYRDGIYPQDLQAFDGEITLAESNLTKARDRLGWSDRMLQKKYVSLAQNLADRGALLNAEIALANARTKKETLVKYTRDKTIKELEAEVEKARSDMLAKNATLQLEEQKENKLRDQIEKCKLYAPIEGLVVYSNETANRPGASNQAMIEEGATVRERQKIFSIPDTAHMRVNTKVHESKIDPSGVARTPRSGSTPSPPSNCPGRSRASAPWPTRRAG